MSKEKEVSADPFAGMEEKKMDYKNIKFGKLGDWFKGTLTDNTRRMKNQLSKDGEMQTVYVFKIHGGSFHNIVDRQVQPEPTVMKEGEYWSYITGKPAITGPMKDVKIGQVVGMRLAEIKKATQPGFDNTKIIKVLIGAMDDTYQGESAEDVEPPKEY